MHRRVGAIRDARLAGPPTRRWALLALAVVILAATCQFEAGAQPRFAKITAVLLTVMHRLRDDAPWQKSKVGTLLPVGGMVRTGRRSKCQITFPDRSFVRMGERSDLVITDLSAKRLRARSGRLFVKIVSGTSVIEGHTAVAAVKGTTFEFIGPDDIPAAGERPIEMIRVWDGFVEFTCGGRTETIGPGTEAIGKPDGTITQGGTPSQNYPGGTYESWFEGEWSGQEVDTTPNSSAGTEQKVQHLTEQQVATVPSRDQQRQEAIQETGSINVDVDSLGRDPARQSHPTGTAALPAAVIAAAAEALLSQAAPGEFAFQKRFFGPTTISTPFTFVGGEQSVYGVRAVGSGVYQDSYFRVATNITDEFDGDLDFSLDEAFLAHRTRRAEWTLGRQRFLNGPVNNTEVGTLHDFGRVASMRWRGRVRGGPQLDIALIDRAETYPGAAGEAAYARAAHSVGPAIVGANVLWLFDEGPGKSVDLSISPIPRHLDLYGEVGEDPTGRDLHTIGLYFPELYQTAGVDVFVEQAKRQGFPSVFSVAAYKQVTGSGTAMLAIEKPSGHDWSVGAGFVLRLGQH